MELNPNLLDALAEALDEDLSELMNGTTRRLPDCTKRQAFLLTLHREHGLSVGQLADLIGKGYSSVYGVIQTAQDYYECGDLFFFSFYEAAQNAYAAWLQNQPEETV